MKNGEMKAALEKIGDALGQMTLGQSIETLVVAMALLVRNYAENGFEPAVVADAVRLRLLARLREMGLDCGLSAEDEMATNIINTLKEKKK